MLMPIQLWHTLQSSDFITYLGSGKSDLRIDIRQGNHLAKNTNEIETMIREDQRIQTASIYETTSLQVKSKEDTLETLYLETGELSTFPLNYLQGRQPLKNETVQYKTSFIAVLSFGAFIGTIAVNTIGPALMSIGGATLGASSLQWLSPQWVSVVYPVTLFIVNLALTTWLLKTFFSSQTTRQTLL